MKMMTALITMALCATTACLAPEDDLDATTDDIDETGDAPADDVDDGIDDAAEDAPGLRARCGYYTGIAGASSYWKNCTASNQLVRVDRVASPDYNKCVKANTTSQIGRGFSARGAKVIGGC